MQLPNLTSLSVANTPEIVRYILAHLDLPAIHSFDISDWDEEYAPSFILPDCRTSKKLFPDPRVFRIESMRCVFHSNALCHFLTLHICGFKIRLISDTLPRDIRKVVTAWFPAVPPSMTTIQSGCSELDQRGWREFSKLTKRCARSSAHSMAGVRSSRCGVHCGQFRRTIVGLSLARA